MAIFHFHRTLGKRHQGKNAVFAVAYIRGEKRSCTATGETKDFSYRDDVLYKNTFLPDDAPIWAVELRHANVKDSQGQLIEDKEGLSFSCYIWDQIEVIERRQKAQLYFHYDIALPVELSQSVAIELVEHYVTSHLAVNGIFCEVAIHWDDINPHAHVITPLRQLTESGFSNKLRYTRKALGEWVTTLRAEWATAANLALKEQGFDVRIDHRSHEARGIALTPTVKIGKATYIKEVDPHTSRLAKNQLIKAHNLNAIQSNPDVLVPVLVQAHTMPTDAHIQAAVDQHRVVPPPLWISWMRMRMRQMKNYLKQF